MRLSLVTEPAGEALTLDEVRTHLKLDQHDDDAYALALAAAVREAFESETGRQLVTATWRATLDCFPVSPHEPIRLPKPPLASVTSIEYVDAAGATQTWDPSEYRVEKFSGPLAQRGMVYPAPGHEWPVTLAVPGAVTITFVAGTDPSLIPEAHRAVLLAWLGDLYENRERQVAGTIVSQNQTTLSMLELYREPALL